MKITIQIKNGYLTPHSQKDIDCLSEFGDGLYEITINNMNTRTLAQNKAYFLWASMISSTLNSVGATVPKIIKLDTMWSREKVHEMILKPTIKALYKKTSTTQLKKDEFNDVIDMVTKAFGVKGIEIPPFPTFED